MGDAAAPRYRLQRIITTRENDHMHSMPPNTIAELEQYADGSAGQVQALQVCISMLKNRWRLLGLARSSSCTDASTHFVVMQLEVAGVRNSDADHAASHLGKAIGIAAILRGTARHAAR